MSLWSMTRGPVESPGAPRSVFGPELPGANGAARGYRWTASDAPLSTAAWRANLLRAALLCVVFFAWTGCASPGSPIISERGSTAGRPLPAPRTASIPRSGIYVVKRGDTLYSIAWRFGLDMNAIARNKPPAVSIHHLSRSAAASHDAARGCEHAFAAHPSRNAAERVDARSTATGSVHCAAKGCRSGAGLAVAGSASGGPGIRRNEQGARLRTEAGLAGQRRGIRGCRVRGFGSRRL